jgi:hypothetical protein
MTYADLVKAGLHAATTALGVLLGLVGNGLVIWWRERRAYRAMLTAIASEGRNNEVVLHRSFLEYFKSCIVLRRFGTAAVGRCVRDALFVRHAKSKHLDILYEYMRNIGLANSYRKKAERLMLGRDKEAAEEWLPRIIGVWEKNLKQCEASINEVVALPNER